MFSASKMCRVGTGSARRMLSSSVYKKRSTAACNLELGIPARVGVFSEGFLNSVCSGALELYGVLKHLKPSAVKMKML